MNSHTHSVPTLPPVSSEGSRPTLLLTQALFTPRTAFRTIRRDPHWLPPLLFFTLATFVHTVVALPFTMSRITAQIRAMNPRLESDALERAAETPRLMMGAVSLLSSLLAPLVIVLLVAGMVHLLAVLLRGDLATPGRAVFAGCAYASLPLSLGTLARVPLIARLQTIDVSLGFDALVPGVHGRLLDLLQFCDGFRLWFVVLLAVAVAVLYRLRAWKAVLVSLAVNAVWFGIFLLLAAASRP